jgi:hypothetical protein
MSKFIQSIKSPDDRHILQIDYLIQQSTQGLHFLFDRNDVTQVLSEPTNDQEFFTLDNMSRVQALLTRFIEAPSLTAKRSYINSLSREEYETVLRAYFHLVENTILGNSRLKH